MRLAALLLATGLLAAAHAGAACGTVRFAYPDQHRPPYWLGNGEEVPEPPGAGVEFVREFAASGDCALTLRRLPVMRMRAALTSGAVDFVPVDGSAASLPGIAMPRDAQGKPDLKRAVNIVVVLFVRAKDGVPHDTEPVDFVRERTVGLTLGATYGAALQQAGARLDAGAASASGNFEKLRLGRIDAFAISLIAPADMDHFVATRYRGELVRLDKPVARMPLWIATNQAYYDSHRAQVEAMWNWVGNEGYRRYNAILRKYTEQ